MSRRVRTPLFAEEGARHLDGHLRKREHRHGKGGLVGGGRVLMVAWGRGEHRETYLARVTVHVVDVVRDGPDVRRRDVAQLFLVEVRVRAAGVLGLLDLNNAHELGRGLPNAAEQANAGVRHVVHHVEGPRHALHAKVGAKLAQLDAGLHGGEVHGVEGQKEKDLAGCEGDNLPCAGRQLAAPALDLGTSRRQELGASPRGRGLSLSQSNLFALGGGVLPPEKQARRRSALVGPTICKTPPETNRRNAEPAKEIEDALKSDPLGPASGGMDKRSRGQGSPIHDQLEIIAVKRGV